MKLFQKKKTNLKPVSPWTPVPQGEIPQLEQPWVGIFSFRDEAHLWLRKSDLPDPRVLLGWEESAPVTVLVFPEAWRTQRLRPQGWPYYRFREGRVQAEGFVDPLVLRKKYNHSQEKGRWDVTTPHTWRFLKFFFPFYSKTEGNFIRSRLEGFYDTWTGETPMKWLGSRGLALGLEEGIPDCSQVLSSLGDLVGNQLFSTHYWSEKQSWKAVEPHYGAPGVTLEVLVLLNGKQFRVRVYLTHNFITDAASRLIPPGIKDLNNHGNLSAVDSLLLIKEVLSDPKTLITERVKIPLSLTLGELLPWFSPRDRRLFLETQVYGKYSVQELKNLLFFQHQGEIYSDPGFAPGALIPYLGPSMVQEWADAGIMHPGSSRDLHTANRNLFAQTYLRLKSDKRLLSPQGRELFDALWTQTENTRHKALIHKFTAQTPSENVFKSFTKPQIQRIVLGFKDRDWASLFWAAPAWETPLKPWFSGWRWQRIRDDVTYLQRENLRGDLDLAEVWKVCRLWTLRTEALLSGRSV